MGNHNKVRLDKNGEFLDNYDADEDNALSDMDYNVEVPIDDPSQVVLHKEMLIDYTDPKRDLRLSSDFMDFSFTESGRFSDTRQLTV